MPIKQTKMSWDGAYEFIVHGSNRRSFSQLWVLDVHIDVNFQEVPLFGMVTIVGLPYYLGLSENMVPHKSQRSFSPLKW